VTNASGMLPDSTGLGPVHLRLSSIAKAIPLWVDVVGLAVIANGESHVELGVAGRTLLALHPGAQSSALGKSVGLFHLALHVPTRLELARLAARLRAAGYPHSGQDHLFSESLYFNDADGNGIEVCLDTPQRASVQTVDGRPQLMTVDGVQHSGLEPLDFDGLLREIDGRGPGDGSLPASTFVGHIHMRSNAPETVMAFYTNVLGFKPNVASAAFFGMVDCGTAATRHIVAFNMWGGRELPKTLETTAGLDAFTIDLQAQAFAEIEARLAAEVVPVAWDGPVLLCSDPDGNRIRIVHADTRFA
jgi:catechol 2,3-dioxygenase